MPEVNHYAFKNMELLETLIKQAGVHEGRWLLNVQFGFAPGNFGPSSDQLVPGVAVVIQNIGIARAPAEAPVEMTLDAAVVNRVPKRQKQKA